ncbi:hypothetical protein ACIBP6_44320 [Nonomuraea terrae]
MCPKSLEVGGRRREAVSMGHLAELVTCGFEGEAVGFAVLAQE